jgi:hypothetical protein
LPDTVAIEMRRHRERRDGGEQDRVAVRGRFCDHVGGDRPARAGAVLDDDALAKVLAELPLHDSSHGVGPAAGREADHEGDRPGRVGLGRRVRRRSQ